MGQAPPVYSIITILLLLVVPPLQRAVDALPLLTGADGCEAQLAALVGGSASAQLSAADLAEYLDCTMAATRRRQHRAKSDNNVDEQQLAAAARLNATLLKTLLEGKIGGSATAEEVRAIWALVGRLADQPSAAESAHMCTTVQCLGSRATTSFNACAQLSESQCTSLVAVLEGLTRSGNGAGVVNSLPVVSDSDEARDEETEELELKLRGAVLSRLGQLLGQYRKWRHDHVTARSEQPLEKPAGDATRNRRSVSDGDTGNEIADDDNDYVIFDEWLNLRVNNRHGELTTRSETGVSAAEAATSSRMRSRRSVLPPGIPFKLPEKMTPETQAILEAYLQWREKNGYGKISGRWG